MAGNERTIDELYQDDPERADAAVFGRKVDVNRRGFLGGSGLAAMSAAVGGTIPFAATMPGGLIPAALAQEKPVPPKGPQHLKFPGKDEGLVVLGDRPLVAETPESLLNDDTTPTARFFIRNNANTPDPVKDPDSWKLTVDGEVNQTLEITLGVDRELPAVGILHRIGRVGVVADEEPGGRRLSLIHI